MSSSHISKHPKWLFLVDGLIVAAVAILAFFLLSLRELEHALILLIAVPVALYSIKHGVLRALFPSVLILALAPLTHFDNLMHGFALIPVGLISGLFHGYVLTNHNLAKRRAMWIILVLEIFLNLGVTLLLLWIAPAGDPFHGEHLVILSLTEEVFASSPYMTGILHKSFLAFDILTGMYEALLTHILVSFFAIYVFKLERGRTFFELYINIPRIVTIYYLIIGAYAAASYTFGNPPAGSFLEMTETLSLNIFIAGTLFYIFQGSGTFGQWVVCKTRKRHSVLIYVLVVLLFPFMLLFGIIDSLFAIRERYPILLHPDRKCGCKQESKL